MTRCDFTLDDYRGFLSIALESGYRFIGFGDLDDPDDGGGPAIVLRHDVDYAPRFIPPMAAIEASLGIRATYCVHRFSSWYRIEAPENRAAIASALDAGHWLGLHFDASAIESDAQVVADIVSHARDLGAAFSREVDVVSFHMPGRRPVEHLRLPAPLINTYEPRFFTEIGYASDSNENWRGVDLADLLRSRVHSRLQLLIHPFWWRPQPATMRSKLEALANEIGVDVHEIVTPEQWQLIEAREAAA